MKLFSPRLKALLASAGLLASCATTAPDIMDIGSAAFPDTLPGQEVLDAVSFEFTGENSFNVIAGNDNSAHTEAAARIYSYNTNPQLILVGKSGNAKLRSARVRFLESGRPAIRDQACLVALDLLDGTVETKYAKSFFASNCHK